MHKRRTCSHISSPTRANIHAHGLHSTIHPFALLHTVRGLKTGKHDDLIIDGRIQCAVYVLRASCSRQLVNVVYRHGLVAKSAVDQVRKIVVVLLEPLVVGALAIKLPVATGLASH